MYSEESFPQSASYEDESFQVEQPKIFKKPNVFVLNIRQFMILMKRHLIHSICSSPFNTLMRMLIPSLFLFFLFLFRLALISQEDSEKKIAIALDHSTMQQKHSMFSRDSIRILNFTKESEVLVLDASKWLLLERKARTSFATL